jgi:MoaA/NifB/PqqE/SkfB family radical SAM enzyme
MLPDGNPVPATPGSGRDDTASGEGAERRLHFDDYVELTMHFKCNLKCVHCMIEGTMDWLEPEGMERLQEVCDYNDEHRAWKGIIFTGSEVTLRPDLPEWARKARRHGFEHVRIQTHGMRLANEDYCHELVDAGIDEYFVSVTAADAETHDAITEIPGSFAKTIRGLENLDAFDQVTTLSNTVVTRLSYRHLPRLVTRLGHLKNLARMDFWNFWPMKESDEKDLVASHLEVLPYLREAISRARALGRDIEVKNFPECLLADDADALENGQPKLVIDPAFWPEFMRNGFNQCVHREQCGAQRCLGLNTAYIEKYGWHEDVLVPLPMPGENDGE